MNGCNDYTNMKRMQQIIKPCYNYDNNRCVNDQNKINYVYVVPNNNQIGYDNNCIMGGPSCPPPPPHCRPEICEVQCPPGPVGPAGPAGKNGDKIITKSRRKCRISPTENSSITIIGEPGVTYTVGIYVICTDISNTGTYFFGIVSDCETETGIVQISQTTNINGTYGQDAIYNITILPGGHELLKLRSEMNYIYKALLGVNLFGNTIPDIIFNRNEYYTNMLCNYFYDKDISDLTASNERSNDILDLIMNTLYIQFFDKDIRKPVNALWNPNQNAIYLDTLENKIVQMYVYFFDKDLEVDVQDRIFV